MIDKNSTLYPAYIEECHKMHEEIIKKSDALYERLVAERYRGMDHPEVNELNREFSRRLKQIQQKYGFL